MKTGNCKFLFGALVATMIMGQSAMAHAACITPKETGEEFRKAEAIRLVEDQLATITNALDNTLFTNGSGIDFDTNVGYVLDLQYDQNNMDITIDSHHASNAAEFKALFSNVAAIYNYRKRFITNPILITYSEKDCLREITMHFIGTSFSITNGIIPPQLGATFVNFDRQVMKWKEKCPGQFRVISLLQVTESSFTLPDSTVIISPPIQHNANPRDNDAPAAYIPPTPKRCRN